MTNAVRSWLISACLSEKLSRWSNFGNFRTASASKRHMRSTGKSTSDIWRGEITLTLHWIKARASLQKHARKFILRCPYADLRLARSRFILEGRSINLQFIVPRQIFRSRKPSILSKMFMYPLLPREKMTLPRRHLRIYQPIRETSHILQNKRKKSGRSLSMKTKFKGKTVSNTTNFCFSGAELWSPSSYNLCIENDGPVQKFKPKCTPALQMSTDV